MTFRTHLDDGGAAASMGDFLANKLLPFMRDEALWVDNRSPAGLTLPQAEVFTHAGTVGTPEPPYFFARTTNDGATLFIATGTGIDTAQEWFDQPGRPINTPNTDTLINMNIGDSFFEGNIRRSACQVVFNHITSGFTGHYLFTDGNGVTPGTYVHAVIQIAANEYRHLLIGIMDKYVSFTGGDYLIGHYWNRYDNDDGTGAVANFLDQPYSSEHLWPMQLTNHSSTDLTANEDNIGRNNWFRASGLRGGVDWWACHGVGNAGVISVAQRFGTNNDPVNVGPGAIVGHGDSLGVGLWLCEPNLAAKAKPLVPFVFMGAFPFEAQERWAALGEIPDCRRVNMRGLAPGEQLTIGSDNWRVYPLVNSNSSVGADNAYSGYEGLAYREA